MGQRSSKVALEGSTLSGFLKEEELQKREIDYITEYLNHQRESVYVIAHSVNGQHANDQSILKAKVTFGDIDTDQENKKEEAATSQQAVELHDTTVHDSTKQLLGRIQVMDSTEKTSLLVSATTDNLPSYASTPTIQKENENASEKQEVEDGASASGHEKAKKKIIKRVSSTKTREDERIRNAKTIAKLTEELKTANGKLQETQKKQTTSEKVMSSQISALVKECESLKIETQYWTEKYNIAYQNAKKSQTKTENQHDKIPGLMEELQTALVKLEATEKKHAAPKKEMSTAFSSLLKQCEQLKTKNKLLTDMYDKECQNVKKLEQEIKALEEKTKEEKTDKENGQVNGTTQQDCSKETKTRNGCKGNDRTKTTEQRNGNAHELDVKDTTKEKGKLQVQIFCQQRHDLAEDIMDALVRMLNSKLGAGDFDLAILSGSNSSDVSTGKALLVLCISIHEVNSDVKKALAGLTATKSTAVLMIHHKEYHALPCVPSESKLSEIVRAGLGSIFDLAFLRGKGLYECPMNDQNVTSIVDFIKKTG